MTKMNKFKDTDITESLSRLIENVMEKTDVVRAVEAITDKLQKIAEDLAKLQADEVMPTLDGMTTAFGQNFSNNFYKTSTDVVNQLIDSVQTAKSAIDKEIQRMKRGIEGGNMSDLSMDMDNPEQEQPQDQEPVPEPQPGEGLPEVPPTDVAGNMEDDKLAQTGFAGRAKK